MDKRAVIEMANRFRESIESRGIKPAKIILYGSYANGTHDTGSDIDIVIISDDFIGKDFWERIGIISDAIYELFAPIEAVGMTMEEWERQDSFIAGFAGSGEILFAA